MRRRLPVGRTAMVPAMIFLLRRFALVTACALAAGCGFDSSPSFLSSDVTGTKFGRDFALTDHTGKPRTLADYRGKVVVLFFGYTQCPDVCPTTLSELAEVMKQLGPEAKNVQVLFATIDPERDTADLLAHYVPTFDPSFVGLYGDADGDRTHGEGIQDRLPEAAGSDAADLFDGPQRRHVRVRPGGPAAAVRRLRPGRARLPARHPRAAAHGLRTTPAASARRAQRRDSR